MSIEFSTTAPATKKAVLAAANKGMLEIAIKVKAQARALVMVDTGDLKSKIGYKTVTVNEVDFTIPVKKDQIIVGANSDHSISEEFGTRFRKKPLNPYLRPAVNIVTKGQSPRAAMAKAQNESVRKVTK